MGQINRVPTGLQSLLDSKNFGQNPSELLEQVRPTLDLFSLLAITRLRSIRLDLNAATNVGDFVETSVAEGEIWIPVAYAIRWEGAQAFVNPHVMLGVENIEGVGTAAPQVLLSKTFSVGALGDWDTAHAVPNLVAYTSNADFQLILLTDLGAGTENFDAYITYYALDV